MRKLRVLFAILIACVFLIGSPGPLTLAAAGQKTVHVKQYTRKDGTVVRAHERKAPESNSSTSKESKRSSSTPSSAFTVPRYTAPDSAGRERSEAAKRTFMKQSGYQKGRPGYVVDHIIPLACGGADEPFNMQWQTIEAGKAKDKVERKYCH